MSLSPAGFLAIFYTAMGAEFLDAWRNVRVSCGALERLARSASDAPSDQDVRRQPAEREAAK